jgi:hypothetical protein
MGFTEWFEKQNKTMKILFSLILISVTTFIGWYIGQILFYVGWTLQQTLFFMAISCTAFLVILIILIIKYKSV